VSPVSTACPSCGAPVEFRYDDTFVRVCSYCNAVVARADRGFASLGRMGDLAQSESPLALWVGGQLGGVGFQLVGRGQIAHPRGGGWEEWYARFDNGTWGWLSEAQGRFQLSFAVPLPGGMPPFEHLVPGQVLPVPLALEGHPPEQFTVAEVGAAAYRAAAGEMPYRLEPGLRFRFADLSGNRGGFATIDAGVDPDDPIALYLGREVTLAELGIAPTSSTGGPSAPEPGGRVPEKVAAHHVACVQCGGSLELRAPDSSLRVTCPYCSAVLDVNQGHLSYLRTLDKDTEALVPVIQLGTAAELEGRTQTVIGCLRRSVMVDGINYPFSEYLLYQPELGYRWLVESGGHWSYVSPVAAGAVAQELNGTWHAKRRFRHFQTATAQVDRIFGEFYWRVEIGEKTVMADYVCPPYMLSSEDGQGEIQWSLGVWMDSRDLSAKLTPPGQKAGSFELPGPSTSSVAPHQPFGHGGVFKVALVLGALLLVAGIVMASRASSRSIDVRFGEAVPAPVDPADPAATSIDAASAPASSIRFSEPFELHGGKNIEVQFDSALANSWLYVQADLVNDDTGMVDSFDAPIEYYSGVEDGESWSEGSEKVTVHLKAVPAGRYVLRVETQWPPGPSAPPLTVTLREGVFRATHLLIAFGALFLIPILVGLRRFLFERRRWAESDHPWLVGQSDE